ncbi:glycosyltransferase family 2 protein [Ohtaekwangia sp.]|uniref:glycosyltransferase family 2 protein n=1 Tax=Ohtaekwangia sp. TaxID=2066019 RepID=UPI002FDEAA42
MTESMLPKISIVTPSFNQSQFIEETMLSVLNQDYPNYEYIVVDGGSTDGSVDIIKKYSDRLAYWISEKDRGFGDAINKGFAKATGEILYWLNSDDLLLPGALLIVGKYFQKYRDTGLVFGDRHIIDPNSKLLSKRAYFFYFPGQLKFGKALPQECTFWRRDVFLRAGVLDEKLKFAIDFDLWCRMSKTAVIRHIPFYLGAFREQPASKSSTITTTGFDERDKILLKYFGSKPSALQARVFHFVLGNARRIFRLTGIVALKRRIISNRIHR